MRILVLATDGFGGHGGIALYARNLLTGLCTHPSKPDVIALPRVVPRPLELLPPGLTWDQSGLGGKSKYLAAVLRAAIRRPDLIVSTHLNLLPLAYAVHVIHRAPLIVFIYGVEAERPSGKRLLRPLLGRIDGVVSIRKHTTQVLERWANLNGVRRYMLENAIHLERYGVAPKNPALVEKYSLAEKKVLMTMGRVEESYKGFDEVLEVMPRLVRELPSLVYIVAGGGYDVPRLQEKARALGVADHVVFTGLIDDSEKADYFRLADVFAMPGRGPQFDRYPLRFVFLEAMACGIPVVGCRPEDEEEARGDGALLTEMVEPRNPDDIVRGILAAFANGQREIPAGLERFSFPSFQRRLHAIVDSVMSR